MKDNDEPSNVILLMIAIAVIAIFAFGFLMAKVYNSTNEEQAKQMYLDKINALESQPYCENVMPFIKSNGYVLLNQDIKGCPIVIKKYVANTTYGGSVVKI